MNCITWHILRTFQFSQKSWRQSIDHGHKTAFLNVPYKLHVSEPQPKRIHGWMSTAVRKWKFSHSLYHISQSWIISMVTQPCHANPYHDITWNFHHENTRLRSLEHIFHFHAKHPHTCAHAIQIWLDDWSSWINCRCLEMVVRLIFCEQQFCAYCVWCFTRPRVKCTI